MKERKRREGTVQHSLPLLVEFRKKSLLSLMLRVRFIKNSEFLICGRNLRNIKATKITLFESFQNESETGRAWKINSSASPVQASKQKQSILLLGSRVVY